jgi:ABC-type amino acid transport system permease subunit
VFAGVAIIYLTLTSLAGLGGKLVERKLAFAQ